MAHRIERYKIAIRGNKAYFQSFSYRENKTDKDACAKCTSVPRTPALNLACIFNLYLSILEKELNVLTKPGTKKRVCVCDCACKILFCYIF